MQSGGQPDGLTAFRQVEKQYLLVKDQHQRGRKSRRKNDDQQLPDLSAVIDLTNADSVQQHLSTGSLVSHNVQAGTAFQASCSTTSTEPLQLLQHHHIEQCTCCNNNASKQLKAYTMPKHPGLLLVPSALPAEHQLELIYASFTQFCEPPAKTNHNREYGPLTGIWRAAQEGKELLVPKKQLQSNNQSEQGGCPCQEHKAQDSIMQHDSSCRNQEQTETQSNPRSETHQLSQGEGTQKGHDRTHNHCQAPNLNGSSHNIAHVTPSFDDCWGFAKPVSGFTPITAASMLKRMRWAVLGPHYDWTARKYISNEPFRPLPDSLYQFAKHWADTATQLCATESAIGNQNNSELLQPTDSPGLAQILNNPDAGRDGDSQQQPCSSPANHPTETRQSQCAGTAPYIPDGALVNFYYEGDTLMGHKDDVERDLDQPIVSLSLGCDAVFLIGGPTKGIAPTPILLRSGDVVVLAGPARGCYHGVPRVLPGRPLPDSLGTFLSTCCESDSQRHAPFLDHMKRCRINMSIRAVQ